MNDAKFNHLTKAQKKLLSYFIQPSGKPHTNNVTPGKYCKWYDDKAGNTLRATLSKNVERVKNWEIVGKKRVKGIRVFLYLLYPKKVNAEEEKKCTHVLTYRCQCSSSFQNLKCERVKGIRVFLYLLYP